MINTSKTIKIVKNNQFFLTKEIIRPKKEEKKIKSKVKPKIKPKTQKTKVFKKINTDRKSPRIQIKLLNMKNSSISYDKPGKIGIKASWKSIEPHETNINKKQKIFPNHKSITKRDSYKYNIKKNNYSILKNSRIRFLLNKSKKKSPLISHFKILLIQGKEKAGLGEYSSAVLYAIYCAFQNSNDSKKQQKQPEPVFYIKNGFRPSQKFREGLKKILNFLHCASLILHAVFPQFSDGIARQPVQCLPSVNNAQHHTVFYSYRRASMGSSNAAFRAG